MQLIPENSDKISSQLSTLGKNIAIIQTRPLEVDCSNLDWISPVSILPLATLIFSTGIKTSGENQYLKTIGFPGGVEDPHYL
ncbi:MAG TPA: hypothetical protein DF383_08680, partial [Deltaproteobacteria bacterium]|nr:hypothetical protein [Deltaproteobacteria bacterium]